MSSSFRIVSVTAVGVLLLTACVTPSKEQIGTMAGGVLGAAVGAKVDGRRGAVIGGLIGAAIGNRIGAHLDENDRKRLAELERQALQTGSGGTFVTNKSKATVTVAVNEPTLEKPRDYGLAGDVQPEPLVLIEPIAIRAYVDTPVYSRTTERDAPTRVIAKGVPIQVSAKVAKDDWMVVGNENVGLGYVPRRYLEANVLSDASTPVPPAAGTPDRPDVRTQPTRRAPAPTVAGKAPSPTPTVASKGPASASSPKPMSKEEYEREMDRLYADYKPRSSEGAGSNRGGSSTTTAGGPGKAAPKVVVAQASSECKVITRQVTPPSGGGEPFSETVKYCNEPPKGWQTQTA